MNDYNDVFAFHQKFGLPRSSVAAPLAPDAFDFRFGFLNEELHEWDAARMEKNLVAYADALFDFNYVVIGTALFIGLDKFVYPWPNFEETCASTPAIARRSSTPKFMDQTSHDFFRYALQSKLVGFKLIHKAAELGEPGALALALESLRSMSSTAYIAAGYAGVPWRECWRHVQNSNMAKERAESDGSNSKRGSGFDVVKPAGWIAPEIYILEELMRRGFNPPDHLIASAATGKVEVMK